MALRRDPAVETENLVPTKDEISEHIRRMAQRDLLRERIEQEALRSRRRKPPIFMGLEVHLGKKLAERAGYEDGDVIVSGVKARVLKSAQWRGLRMEILWF